MIQIQNPGQFTAAERRAREERMLVQAAGSFRFLVTNRSKGTSYHVLFSKLDGKFFGTCGCAAGSPMHRNQMPLVCKHLFAAYLVLRALSGRLSY